MGAVWWTVCEGRSTQLRPGTHTSQRPARQRRSQNLTGDLDGGVGGVRLVKLVGDGGADRVVTLLQRGQRGGGDLQERLVAGDGGGRGVRWGARVVRSVLERLVEYRCAVCD